jgi:hypothetical protein
MYSSVFIKEYNKYIFIILWILNCNNYVCLLIIIILLQFYTAGPIVCVPGFEVIMYKKHYKLLKTRKEKYAFACNYACIQFNFNVLFVKCFALFFLSSICQMFMAH